MNKEEARKKQAELKCKIENCKDSIKYLNGKISELEAIINKEDDWRLVEVPDEWQELYEEKALLMADMMHFAYVRNEGWLPDWENGDEYKWGITFSGYDGVHADWEFILNEFAFGIAVKSEEIAEEMFKEFGERIEAFYNKQY